MIKPPEEAGEGTDATWGSSAERCPGVLFHLLVSPRSPPSHLCPSIQWVYNHSGEVLAHRALSLTPVRTSCWILLLPAMPPFPFLPFLDEHKPGSFLGENLSVSLTSQVGSNSQHPGLSLPDASSTLRCDPPTRLRTAPGRQAPPALPTLRTLRCIPFPAPILSTRLVTGQGHFPRPRSAPWLGTHVLTLRAQARPLRTGLPPQRLLSDGCRPLLPFLGSHSCTWQPAVPDHPHLHTIPAAPAHPTHS